MRLWHTKSAILSFLLCSFLTFLTLLSVVPFCLFLGTRFVNYVSVTVGGEFLIDAYLRQTFLRQRSHDKHY